MSVTSKFAMSGSYLMPSLEHAAVSDAMRPGVMACGPDTPLTEVARMMSTRHVHCVLVMSGSLEPDSDQDVWGLISALELVASALQTGPDTTAAVCAQKPVLSVHATTPLREAAELMVLRQAAHALVTDPVTNRPTGVLSTLDIAGIIGWGEA